MRVLGIDPGLTRCGLGVVEAPSVALCHWLTWAWCVPAPTCRWPSVS